MSLADTILSDADWLFSDDDRACLLSGTFTAPLPGGEVWSCLGSYNDISARIDLVTGIEIASQEAYFSVRRSAVQAAIDASDIPTFPTKGWKFSVTVNSEVRDFIISETKPDRMLGYIVYVLQER